MIERPSPPVDDRTAADWYTTLLRRRDGFVPEWRVDPGSAGSALGLVHARFIRLIRERQNQAPHKHKLAFFDLLGLEPAPAQPARAPLVFRLVDGAPAGQVAAGTPFAAPPPPGGTAQIVFETERACAIMPARVVQVVSLWPGRDEYIDHSAGLRAGVPVHLFRRNDLQPSPHHLYLAHPTLLALAGNVVLTVEVQLTEGGAEPLRGAWEYWDGKVWRGFADTTRECRETPAADPDGTDGWQQSGVVRLEADCAKSEEVSVNGVAGYWIRNRLTEPLLTAPNTATAAARDDDGCAPAASQGGGDAANPLPLVERIRVSSIVARPFTAALRPVLPAASTDVRVVLRRIAINTAGPLTGRVVNEAGHPLSGAVVTLLRADGTQAASSLPTGVTGQYALPLVDPQGASLRLSFADVVADATLPDAAAAGPRMVLDLELAIGGIQPDQAFGDGTKLDVSIPFQPFGAQPQPGSAFYFTSEEIFTKPGADLRIYLPRTSGPQDVTPSAGTTPLDRSMAWEYWNGHAWVLMERSERGGNPARDLATTEILAFTVPEDLEPVDYQGVTARWMRARLLSGGFGYRQDLTVEKTTISVAVSQPPFLSDMRMGYTWQYGPFLPERVLTFNDFTYRDRTDETRWPGLSFLPFERITDRTPAVYVGFDRKPPVDAIGLFVDVVEDPSEVEGPELEWEFFDGFVWRPIAVDDETNRLRVPGIVSFIGAASSAALRRFGGEPLHWLRGRLKEDGPPGEPEIRAILPNATWASQQRTQRNVILGTSRGIASETFVTTSIPVMPGERLEVRELAGASAAIEWRTLAIDLFGGNRRALDEVEEELAVEDTGEVVRGPLRLRRDRRKQISEVWVAWESRRNFLLSGPADRHYTIDRPVGRIRFGDGIHGRVLPAGAVLAAAVVRSGGGSQGNVSVRTITQTLGAVAGLEAVFNCAPAEGGADGESLTAFEARAPLRLRHRGRALSARDYETLAFEASAAVGFARAIPMRDPTGRTRPGWITLVIVPASKEPRPWPSFGLRRQITAFLSARANASLAAPRIWVTGPRYVPVDVDAVVAPLDPSQAGTIERSVREALERFFHPLTGGPAGEGWGGGRDVHLSDVAAITEGVSGVDYVEDLQLRSDGEPRGERIAVGDDYVVVAGELRLHMKAAER